MTPAARAAETRALRARLRALREQVAMLQERVAMLQEGRRPIEEDTAMRAVVMSPEMALARRVGVRSCVAEYAKMKHLYSMR